MKQRAVFISFLLLFNLISQITYSQFTCWEYRTPITIQENSSTVLGDYQVLLKVNTEALISSGKMNLDGSDIRFAESFDTSTQISYWIEAYLNTDSTMIWVRVLNIPASGLKRIYMYHGNDSAQSKSSVSNTFLSVLGSL